MENTAARKSGKEVRDFFFNCIDKRSGIWQCRCGTQRKSGRGYANFVSHVSSQHLQDLQKFQEEDADEEIATPSNQRVAASGASNLFFSKKAMQIHSSLELVILSLLPFSILSSDVLKRNLKCKPITFHTLKKYMLALTDVVEKKIAKMLPDKFALIIDGWSSAGTHYLAVFASFKPSKTDKVSQILLGFSPFEDETSMNAESHFDYISFVLSEFQKSFDNVVALIADNCPVNIALVRKMDCGFIGCASHRFNLAVKDMLKEDNTVIDKVHALMKQLRRPIAAAKLRRLTHLRAKCANATRWSSTADMLVRYKKIREVLKDLNDDDVDFLEPTPRENKRIDDLCVKFEEWDTVTKALQREWITCADVRFLFEEVMLHYPSTCNRLSASAAIIATEDFERGVVKILDGKEVTLTACEKMAVAPLLKTVTEVPVSSSGTTTRSETLAERALKKKKLSEDSGDQYMDLRFLSPTSNVCERFFSKAGHALTDRRQSIHPAAFEQQMFLHMNSSLWGISEVDVVIQNVGTSDESSLAVENSPEITETGNSSE